MFISDSAHAQQGQRLVTIVLSASHLQYLGGRLREGGRLGEMMYCALKISICPKQP